ncbi:hypothetical protein NQZ68_034303 [Dissostichus eleginoides]|nr:hypothetical protein NQZ68_034303 [Dissostichus eleginoides]
MQRSDPCRNTANKQHAEQPLDPTLRFFLMLQATDQHLEKCFPHKHQLRRLLLSDMTSDLNCGELLKQLER